MDGESLRRADSITTRPLPPESRESGGIPYKKIGHRTTLVPSNPLGMPNGALLATWEQTFLSAEIVRQECLPHEPAHTISGAFLRPGRTRLQSSFSSWVNRPDSMYCDFICGNLAQINQRRIGRPPRTVAQMPFVAMSASQANYEPTDPGRSHSHDRHPVSAVAAAGDGSAAGSRKG